MRLLDERGADEGHGDVGGFAIRYAGQARTRGDGAEASQLAAVCVAANRHRQRSDGARRGRARGNGAVRVAGGGNAFFDILRQQDQARACAQHRQAGGHAGLQRVEHAKLAQHLRLRRALASRQNQGIVGLFDIGPLTKLDAFAPQLRQRALMLDKRPLNSQNSDFLRHRETLRSHQAKSHPLKTPQVASKSARAAAVRRIAPKQAGIGLWAMPAQLRCKTACRSGPQRRASSFCRRQNETVTCRAPP